MGEAGRPTGALEGVDGPSGAASPVPRQATCWSGRTRTRGAPSSRGSPASRRSTTLRGTPRRRAPATRARGRRRLDTGGRTTGAGARRASGRGRARRGGQPGVGIRARRRDGVPSAGDRTRQARPDRWCRRRRDVVHRPVRGVGVSAYTIDQVSAWAPRAPGCGAPGEDASWRPDPRRPHGHAPLSSVGARRPTPGAADQQAEDHNPGTAAPWGWTPAAIPVAPRQPFRPSSTPHADSPTWRWAAAS